MKMVDQNGNAVEIPDEQAGQAFRSGQYGFEQGAKIPVADESGTVGSIDAGQASLAFSNPDLQTVSQDAFHKAAMENKYGGLGGEAASFGIGAGDALTLGLGKGIAVEGAGVLGGAGAREATRKAIAGYTETNPKSEIAGQVVGTAAPLLAGGVGGLAGKGIRGAGAGVRAVDALGGAAERGVASLVGEGGGLLSRATTRGAGLAARGAAEGSIYGAGGAVSDSILKNEDLTAERIMSGAWEGAKGGAMLGAGLGATIEVASTAIRKATNATIGRLAKAARAANEAAGKVAGEEAGAAGQTVARAAAEGEAVAAPRSSNDAVAHLGETKAPAAEVHGGEAHAAEGVAEETAHGEPTLIKTTDDVGGAARYAPEALNSDKAFPRRARYARGARDVLDPEFGDTDLPLGGRPGADTEIEELRSALNAESINSKHRADKVERLMQIVPEGAHPDWVMKMTEAQRAAMSDFVGVPDSSAVTWRALADRVAEREGIKGWPPSSATPAEVIEHPAMRQMPKVAAAPAAAEPAAAAAEHAAALTGAPLPPDAPVHGAGTPGHDVWRDMVGRIVDWSTHKLTGKAIGAVVGGVSHGPVGYLAGAAMGAAVDRVLAKHMEAVNSKISSAVASFLEKGATSTAKAPSEFTGKTAGAVASLFGHAPTVEVKPKTLDGQYHQATAAVSHLAANPAAATTQLHQAAELMSKAPGVAAKIANKQTVAIKFLQSKLPPSVVSSPLSAGRVKTVSDMDKASFLRTLRAVQRPLSVVEDMKDGKLSREGVEAMKAVYPESYADLRTKVLDRVTAMASEGQELAYEQKLQIGRLFGVAVDPTQTPEVQAAVKQIYAQMGNVTAPDAGGGGAPPGAAPKHQVDTAGAHETMTTKLEERA